MNRLPLLVALVLLGVAVAFVDLLTGWTVPGGPAAVLVVLGLLGSSIALFVLMLIAVIRDRRFIVAHSSDARWVLGRASRGLRWSSLFAIGLCLLLFANCSGGSGVSGPVPPASQAPIDPRHGQAVLVSGPIQDPVHFWLLAAWVLAPMVLALLIPAMLAFSTERLATQRPHTARMLGRLAPWSVGAVVAAGLLTVVISLFVGFNACLAAPPDASAGYCSAGIGGMMNLLSVGTLALFLPYLLLIRWALGEIHVGPGPTKPGALPGSADMRGPHESSR